MAIMSEDTFATKEKNDTLPKETPPTVKHEGGSIMVEGIMSNVNTKRTDLLPKRPGAMIKIKRSVNSALVAHICNQHKVRQSSIILRKANSARLLPNGGQQYAIDSWC